MSYIGQKKIKEHKITEKTSSGIEVVEVQYEDETKERFSKLMFDAIVSETACDASQLRDKRIQPIVKELLGVLRNWGIKLSELQYMSVLLDTSIRENEKEAMRELWAERLPNLLDTEDVDLISIDLVLRQKKDKPILSPFNPNERK